MNADHGTAGKSGNEGPSTGARYPQAHVGSQGLQSIAQNVGEMATRITASATAASVNRTRVRVTSTRHWTPMKVTPISCSTSTAQNVRHAASVAYLKSTARPTGECSE